MKTLFKNCTILSTGDDGCFKVLKDSSLGVNGNIIDYIGKDPVCENYDSIKDMHGDILMPGLVNAHGHSPAVLLRGIGSGFTLHDWLYNAVFPTEDKMTPESIEIGQRWAIIEMLRCGTTMVTEMYDYPWNAAKVLKESGMRAHVTRCGFSLSQSECIPPNRLYECIDFVKNWNDPDGRVISDFSIHSEYCSNEYIERGIAEANQDFHRNVQIHVSETENENEECRNRHNGMSPIQYFNSLGIFEENTYCAHCIWVDEKDMDIIKEKHVSPVYNISSNLKLGSGIAPINQMADMGINIAIGTDGCGSNNNLNMFEEMHLGSMVRKGMAKDPTVAGAEETLKMATINGAKALGHKDTGMLKVGMKADIIAVTMDVPHMFPALDIPNLLVYSAQGSDVTMTMVDGNILYYHGEYTTIDVDRAKYEMEKEIIRLYN